MIHNRLGQTDMIVSKIALGGANFGDIYGSFDVPKVEKIVREAFKCGINLIDTAYWYGQGKSEERLGHVLQKFPRSSYYITTKIGRYEKDLAKMFDFSAQKTVQAFDNCLARLQLPSIDLIQIHDVEFASSPEIILNQTLPVLDRIRQSGKVRYIGITGYDLDYMCDIVKNSRVKIDTVLSFGRATLHDTLLTDCAPILEKSGVGIINASSLSLGLLTPQGAPDWHPAPEWMKQKCVDAAQFCKANGRNLADVARKFSFNLPGPATTVIGVDEIGELYDAVLSLKNPNEEDTIFIAELRKKYFNGWPVNNWQETYTDLKRSIYEERDRIIDDHTL